MGQSIVAPSGIILAGGIFLAIAVAISVVVIMRIRRSIRSDHKHNVG